MKKINFLLVLAMLMLASFVFAQSNAPLCFTARNGSVIVEFEIVNVTHTIQYSTDGSTWNTYTSRQYVLLSANQSVWFRAASNQTTATPFAYFDGESGAVDYSQFRLISTDGGTVEGSGNIMSLYGPDCPDLPLQRYAFYGFFQSCTILTTEPALPATTLADQCYYMMFAGCTSLVTPPALPAMTLADSCYSLMFAGCSSLVTPPALPAMTLAKACYSQMFNGCSLLVTVPTLPATTLTDHCYFYMFQNCRSLVTPPALPADTMAYACYRNMFDGCSSLAAAPELPATTLAESCYNDMFRGCTSLKIPPALPATKMAVHCYTRMFKECSSLTILPELPADTLVDNCYFGMFNMCGSLMVNTTGPGKRWMISASTTTSSSLNNMFSGTSGTMKSTPNVNTTYYIASAPKYSVTVNVNDSTMGNVTGAGTAFYEGDTATLTATPNAGYEFDCWSNGEKSQTISIVVVSDTVMSASFKIKTGVEDLQNNEFVVYSEKSNIVVSGAMNKKVSIYDLNGRLVAETPNANETHEFAVGMTGIYMVCIDDRNTVKVIVK